MVYKDTQILIDGGPAMTDLGKFRQALAMSIGLTEALPLRFGRFAERVLGPGAPPEAKAALKLQLTTAVARGKLLRAMDDKVVAASVEEGFGRLDAINRIGNEVFAVQLDEPANYAATDAPVAYPHIWDASWIDWVQYNGSIEQPMIRNVGEAMGVRALVNLTSHERPLFNSTVPIEDVYDIEQLLAGREPPHPHRRFSGLTAPAWPEDVLGKIDLARAQAGERLYGELCQKCHLAPVKSPEFWNDDHWSAPNAAGERYLRAMMIPISHVGTDDAQARGMANRTVKVPAYLELNIAHADGAPEGTYSFGPALGAIVEKVVVRAYDLASPPLSAADRYRLNGYRPNGIRAPLAYKARPLDGIWATSPYLHNGSVPTLYALLSPADQRPATFYLGHREFDPIQVGYRTDALDGGFVVDTKLAGNRNTGHEFRNGPKGNGVIGRELSEDERNSLIEFLKTL